jgi:hypothetical protein
MNIPLIEPMLHTKAREIAQRLMLKIFRQTMDGFNRSGHDKTLTFDPYLVSQQE